jgi:hypothetical protein
MLNEGRNSLIGQPYPEATRNAKVCVKQRSAVQVTSHWYMRRIVVVGLLAVLSAIFLVPGVTLPKTTLRAQERADELFWFLAAAVPELLTGFTGRPQLSRTALSEIISKVPCRRPSQIVLIC